MAIERANNGWMVSSSRGGVGRKDVVFALVIIEIVACRIVG